MNYHRFYALLKHFPGDADYMKQQLVHSYTSGRTTHLHEMTASEYRTMCDALEERTGYRSFLKKKRSECLLLMQRLGIDTTDWQRINAFCRDPRIAGKPFASLSVGDLHSLAVRLRIIQRRGGLKATQPFSVSGGSAAAPRPDQQSEHPVQVIININQTSNKQSITS